MSTEPNRDEIDDAMWEAMLDHADAVAELAWEELRGYDAAAVLTVIGTLLAAVEKQLTASREEILEEICNVADSCGDGASLH